MKRLLLVPAVALAIVIACSADRLPAATGQFVAPAAFAATSGGDRDLLFIANSGTDELRALQICSTPLLADGGADPSNTCPSNEDFQFLPGPSRLYPATINVIARPTRLAAARLCAPDGGTCSTTLGGVAMVAGADARLAVVDARYLVDVANFRGPADGGPVQTLALEAPALDVVAPSVVDPATQAEIPQPGSRGYVAIRAHGTAPAKLVAVDVTLDARGYAAPPTLAGSCTLPGVTPRRLAMAKGDSTRLFLADGANDGALEIQTSAVNAGGADCGGRRISFGSPLRSVAASPAFQTDPGAVRAPGALLAGVTEDGRLLFARTSDGQILPVPSAGFDDTTASLQRMEALNPLQSSGSRDKAVGGGEDVVFLDAPRCDTPPCTTISAGTAPSTQKVPLLAVVTASDGAGYFVDVVGRRFVNNTFYREDRSQRLPAFSVLPAATDIAFKPADPTVPGGRFDGWRNAGVTRTARWTATYHSNIPGLERRGGNVKVNADGTMTFETQGQPLTAWQTPPVSLRTTDAVSFGAYFFAEGQCPELVNETPLRVELTITGFPGPNTVTLQPVADTAVSGFHPNPATCPSFGAVAEFRAVADQPWLVRSGNEVRTRLAPNVDYVARNTRFDYSDNFDLPESEGGRPQDATTAANIEVSFRITRTDPVIGTQLVFALLSQQAFVAIRDPIATPGLATGVLAYTSRRYLNLMYLALTGSNEVIQADPVNLTLPNGVLAYR